MTGRGREKRALEESEDNGNDDMFADGVVREHVSDDDLDLDTVRASARRAAVKEDYSSGSEEEFRQSEAKRRAGLETEELGGGLEREELREWTKVESREGTLGEGDQIEPFNMHQEMEEGDFDRETGGYVLKRDEGAREDSWLGGITREQMRKAAEAREKRRIAAEIAGAPVRSVAEMLADLIAMLELGESPLEALQRRKPSTGARRFDAKSKRAAAGQTPEEKAADEQRRRDIGRITECCTLLLESGLSDVYDMTREELQRHANKT